MTEGLLTKSFTYALDRHYIISTPAINLVVPTKKQPKKTTRSKHPIRVLFYCNKEGRTKP